MNKLTLDPKSGQLRGLYRDLRYKLKLLLTPTGEKPDGHLPTHRVLVETADGAIDVGAAWAKHGKTGRAEGKIIYSMTLDDPSFDDKLNLWAFPGDKGNEFEIVWRRQREDASEAS